MHSKWLSFKELEYNFAQGNIAIGFLIILKKLQFMFCNLDIYIEMKFAIASLSLASNSKFVFDIAIVPNITQSGRD